MSEDMEMDTRVDDLWFSSDSLVIRAQRRIFRVTKSILAARSSVFRDMVAFPQPAGEETETIEGCPVVSLSDSAADVEVFLRAIFDSSYFMPPPTPVALDVVLGILRLANKYDVHYLYRRALDHLSVPYGPSSLADYRSPPQDDHIIYPTARHLSNFATISAVREVGALWLLPIAYYSASSATKETLRSLPAQGIDAHTVQTCIAAHSDLIRGSFKMHSFLFPEPDGYCQNDGQCEEYRLRRFNEIVNALYEELDLAPLQEWDELDWEIVSNGALMCEHCITRAKELHTTVLKEFWERLPSIFGLPPWAELNAMRDAETSGDAV